MQAKGSDLRASSSSRSLWAATAAPGLARIRPRFA
jgi:hypothetical protein